VGGSWACPRLGSGLAASRGDRFQQLVQSLCHSSRHDRASYDVRLARAPGNVLVHEGTAGLDRDSVVNVSQIVTVDRSELQERLGVLPQQLLAQLDNGLRLALDV